jgi:hypothetical protein
MAQRVSNTTTDHDIIRRWAEERGGKPAEVASTGRGDQTGIVRIDFPGFAGEGKLREISWDEWFQKFDEANLALVYEETTSGGERSNFNKLVARETAEARARGERTSRRAAKAGARGARATGARGAAQRGASGRRQASRAEAASTARSKRTSRSSKPRGSTARGRKTGAGRTARARGGPRKGAGRKGR